MLMCAFVAAMCSRNKPYAKKRQAAKHAHSLQSTSLDDAVSNANARFVEATLSILTPMLFRMCAGIYIVVDHDRRFISSDNPCVWHDPAAYGRRPGQRQPALMLPDIEITLPLGPKAALIFTHNPQHSGFRKANAKCVDTINQRTRFRAHEWFVTHDGRDEKIWYEERPLRADAWENTREGRKRA